MEIHQVCRTIVTWHRYAPEVKAELYSTAIISDTEAYLVDPIAISQERLQTALGPSVAGVVVTNENHGRSAADAAAAFGVPLYAHSGTRQALNLPLAIELSDGKEFAPGLTALAIEGAPAGEIAIYAQLEGGTLIIGDALVNMGSYGFALLPAKYCENQKRMRRSLRKLLDLEFERIVFAHGLPVVTNSKRRLAELLEPGS